ncbi:hypothetical protein HMPREF0971_00593 [Segatella oris F0302]|uniref:Uncharacterized protein n=1 Tax=Segatella oris F0302 TaxID=649760 RepID=D1QNU3_9BACT|nr:hypothetical protein HMPREF0971_00593 [Segatella oris F0302]
MFAPNATWQSNSSAASGYAEKRCKVTKKNSNCNTCSIGFLLFLTLFLLFSTQNNYLCNN